MNGRNKGSVMAKIIIFCLSIILLFCLTDSMQKSSQISDLTNKATQYESELSTTKSNSNTYKNTSTNHTKNSNNNYFNSEVVYITNTGSKYHRSGCSYLKSKNAITKSEAINKGYTPCSRCKP